MVPFAIEPLNVVRGGGRGGAVSSRHDSSLGTQSESSPKRCCSHRNDCGSACTTTIMETGTIEKPEKHHMGQVVPGVWVGGLAALSHLQDPRRNRKWTVISILSSNRMIKLSCDLLSQYDSNECIIQEHVVWMLDDNNQADLLSENHLARIFSILDQASTQNACLIHCAKGSSRSVSVCAAWLLYSKRFTSLEGALERIRRVRRNANPNLSFVASLRALEQCGGDVSKARERLSRFSRESEDEDDRMQLVANV